MKIFDYNHDEKFLEIFPEEIFSNPLIVFHGTTTYHSESIEKKGLIVNTAPYNIDYVKRLVETLKSNEFLKYDLKKGFFKWTTSFGIEHYLDSIEKKDYRISFLCLSSACVPYTMSDKKGGQAFRDIREAKQIIDTAIKNNSTLESKLPTEVIELFQELNNIDNSQGVVYAVKLPENLIGISYEADNIIHSDKSISPDLIIGKIIIPENPAEIKIELQRFTSKNKEKLYSKGGLAEILWRNKNQFKNKQ